MGDEKEGEEVSMGTEGGETGRGREEVKRKKGEHGKRRRGGEGEGKEGGSVEGRDEGRRYM